MILAGDIGGTKTNLAYFSAESGKLVRKQLQSYPSRDFKSLKDVLVKFQADFPSAVMAAAFGIAGPVVNGRSKLTNLGWDVVGSDIASHLNLTQVGLLNDLEATAYGALRLDPKEYLVLNKGVAAEKGTIAVIAAGTGLGEGGLHWDGKRYRTIASEGGHTDFGPRDETEIDLLRFLKPKYGRVSYERVVAGPAIIDLYDFLRKQSGEPEPEWLKLALTSGDPSAVISKAGLERRDKVSAQTLDIFASLYGAEAGNLALKILATGGVFVGGGIAPKILPKIQDGSFFSSFKNKGRYEGLMKNIPIWIILNDQTALLGAAHYAELILTESL